MRNNSYWKHKIIEPTFSFKEKKQKIVEFIQSIGVNDSADYIEECFADTDQYFWIGSNYTVCSGVLDSLNVSSDVYGRWRESLYSNLYDKICEWVSNAFYEVYPNRPNDEDLEFAFENEVSDRYVFIANDIMDEILDDKVITPDELKTILLTLVK